MKRILKTIAGLLFLSGCAFAGYFGRDWAQGNFSLESGRYLRSGRLVGVSNANASDVFSQSYKSISRDYYKPFDQEQLKYAALAGATAALGDPHTMFMEPKFAEEFRKDTQGRNEYAGIGARLQPDPMGVKLISIFRGSPAQAAQLQPSDIVTGVEGQSVSGKPVDQIRSKIMGLEGTKVNLTIFRPSTKQSFERAVKRAKITVPTADGWRLEGTNVGYVQVLTFAANTPQQFSEVIGRLEQKPLDGLVIDLRNNPGGLLETAREMLSLFVSDRLVVKTVGRDGTAEVTSFPDFRKDLQCPIAILVNEESASASEIFAGVMRDYRLATLVGEHTYGKASVQNLQPLMDGAVLKVTIAKYFLPSGRDIMRKVDDEGQYVSGGIKPDVEIPLSLGPKTAFGDLQNDNQLQKAVEVLRQKR